MKVLNSQGHTTLEWDPADTETVDDVRAEFDKLVKQLGRMAVVVEAPGKARQITQFDPKAEEIMVIPRLVGGCSS
jgi:hypothetical protein